MPWSPRKSAPCLPIHSACTTSAAASRSGLRIAGTKTTAAHPPMVQPGSERIAAHASCAADPGATMRATSAQQVGTITMPPCATRPTESAWYAHPDREGTKMLTRRIVLSSLLPLVAAGAVAAKTPAPKEAYLYIIWPTDG